MAIKTFVLDTNVLLHSAQSIESFLDNDVVIPMAVVEELDKFKRNSDELGRNARQVIRHLDRMRKLEFPKTGCLKNGVPLSSINPALSGHLFVIAASPDNNEVARTVNSVFGSELQMSSPDNRILRVAYELNQQGKQVVFISQDINLRLKADVLGLSVMDFEREKVSYDSLQTGYREITSSHEVLEQIYRERVLSNTFGLLPNEFVVLRAENATGKSQSALARCRADGNVQLMDNSRIDTVWNVSPRNKEQRMALDLLLDPEVRLVTLVGGAGTGKTLLALAAGMQLVLNSGIYDRILVSRPIIPLGNDIGFLPGNKDSKLSSWMQPIFDNLDFLLGSEAERKGKSSSRYSREGLLNSKKLELEALTYIRGRSIPNQYVIVDEAQNLTPHEIKTIISRCGEGTKMILTGDPNQIDNPYLDASSNGLSYTADRMKGEKLFGHVRLAQSERSELAATATRVL